MRGPEDLRTFGLATPYTVAKCLTDVEGFHILETVKALFIGKYDQEPEFSLTPSPE